MTALAQRVGGETVLWTVTLLLTFFGRLKTLGVPRLGFDGELTDG